MYVPDYLAGFLSLPPASGEDTNAPFFASAIGDVASAATTSGGTASAAQQAQAALDGPSTPVTATGHVVPGVGTGSANPWYVQLAIYVGLAILAVVLIALGANALLGSPVNAKTAALATGA